jgi:hypothetical protein
MLQSRQHLIGGRIGNFVRSGVCATNLTVAKLKTCVIVTNTLRANVAIGSNPIQHNHTQVGGLPEILLDSTHVKNVFEIQVHATEN